MLGRPNCMRAGIHQELAGRVIERVGHHRFHDRDVVHDLAEMRQQFGKLGSALAVALRNLNFGPSSFEFGLMNAAR